MSSLIETTVGEVLDACERTHAYWVGEHEKHRAAFAKEVADYEQLSWWKKMWEYHPDSWRVINDNKSYCIISKENVRRTEQVRNAVSGMPRDTNVFLDFADARLIGLGKKVRPC